MGQEDEEREGREAIVPSFERIGMAHPRVVRATKRWVLAPWFRRPQSSRGIVSRVFLASALAPHIAGLLLSGAVGLLLISELIR